MMMAAEANSVKMAGTPGVLASHLIKSTNEAQGDRKLFVLLLDKEQMIL
jgi:hypothetical protein